MHTGALAAEQQQVLLFHPETMALPLRPRSIPQCSACIRSYTFGALGEPAATHSALNQQVRGKKKLANGSNTVPVRLLKDVKTFGRKGNNDLAISSSKENPS